MKPESFSTSPIFDFKSQYQPNDNWVSEKDPLGKSLHPKEEVDFSEEGSYSSYNWELFFHIPFMIANHLSNNQRFEEAQKWFHYIFDPTDTSSDLTNPLSEIIPERYWQTKPFFEASKTARQSVAKIGKIKNLLRQLTKKQSDPSFIKQIDRWRADPFKPHLIARMRISAYQKTVVMKYLDNLIAWADQLFRRDTIESINEATQLYILAAEILGKRPEVIPPKAKPQVQTYNSVKDKLGDFSNAMVQIENLVSMPSTDVFGVSPLQDDEFIDEEDSVVVEEPRENWVISPEPPLPKMLYFCLPHNEKLLGYWDTIEDRLFKIRHCMNIEGVVRQLPLFQPPIDPSILVRAVASGIDISSALNDLNAPLPHYRFQVMLQKTLELCNDVRNLGATLLSALEKKDAEELALLRSGQEVSLLKQIKQIKKEQVNEAKKALEATRKARNLAETRQRYYSSREHINLWEGTHIVLVGGATIARGIAQLTATGASAAKKFPDGIIGNVGPFPTTLGIKGGSSIGSSGDSLSRGFSIGATMLESAGQISSVLGSYQRRKEEWDFQADLAKKDIEQIDKQIAAAEIRHEIANKELENHDQQIEDSKAVDEFMRSKFTDKELYTWMVSQLSTMYFQSYQMTYDLAKQAEKAFQHEIGDKKASFVQFGYWDSLKKGLLAGDKLAYDLKRMDVAYLDQNKREYELTKHISLAQLDPSALIQLKQTGECFINIPEVLFDLDYPGHYMRRIKTVSITIPAVTSPYNGVPCTLSLLRSSIRHNNTVKENKYMRLDKEDSRFTDSFGAIQSVVTSSGQNDSGLFETNLRDERYLPFEGAGVISNWRIELPSQFQQFDYDTISDVVLHFQIYST